MNQKLLTLRERQRAATRDEIVSIAVEQLRTEGEFSVRSVSKVVGLTSQGMYTYVSSTDELRALVTQKILDGVFVEMARTRDRYQAPVDRIVAASIGFRNWALNNRAEFRHAFTNSDVGPLPPETLNTPQRMGNFFAPLFADLADHAKIEVPLALDPDYVKTNAGQTKRDRLRALAGWDDPALIWLFQFAWAKLFGIVALEAFHQIEAETIASGHFFSLILIEIGDRLGLSDPDAITRIFADNQP